MNIKGLFFLIFVIPMVLYSYTLDFSEGFTRRTEVDLLHESRGGLGFSIKVNRVRVENALVNNHPMHSIIMPELYSPKEPGEPLLPSVSRMIALPQGAILDIRITGSRKRVIDDVVPTCNPESIPENPANSLVYKPDSGIYFGHNIYPQEIVSVSEPFKMRGVDVCIVTITPFQWNSGDSSLTIYTNLNLQASFIGGNGHFGEDRLRGKYWDRILQSNIMNYRSLERIDYSQRIIEKQSLIDAGYPYGAEFVIICPDDDDFIYWANVMKDLRQEEGIITEVFTLSEVGSTFDQIESWIDYAYYSWPIAPEGILLLGDCKDAVFTEGIPSKITHCNNHGFYTWASDNYYADIDCDPKQLPDIAIGRIPARNETDLENYFEKLLFYELNPITDIAFYQKVLVSGAFIYLDDNGSDFHVLSEITKGFFENKLKNVVRLYTQKDNPNPPSDTLFNKTWLPKPGDHPRTPGRLDYFISLGYITERIPRDFLNPNLWGKTATDINNTINNGCFLVYNHGHGGVGDAIPEPSHWSQPWYTVNDLCYLSNNNKLPYVYALGCWTGKFDDTIVHHAENFILLEPGPFPRGSIGNTAASMKWGGAGSHFHGYLDFLYPNFDPLYPFYEDDTFQEALPGFALVSGKYYAVTRMAGWSTGAEIVRFHHFGDPYLRLYTEVPSSMIVTNPSYISAGKDEIYITAPLNSMISLMNNGEIIGRAEGLGYSISVPIVPQETGSEIELIVTKQNCFRYYDTINVYSSDGVYLRYTQIDTIKTYHGNGQINPTKPGKRDTLILEMVNFGEDNSAVTDFILQTTSSYIDIYDETLSVSIGACDTAYLSYEYMVNTNPPDKSIVNFSLVYEDGSKGLHEDNFSLRINCPIIEYERFYYSFFAGETAHFDMQIENIGSGSGYDYYFITRSLDSNITIIDSIFDPGFDEIIPGSGFVRNGIAYFYIEPDVKDSYCNFEIQMISDSIYSIKDTITLKIPSWRFFESDFEEIEGAIWTFSGDESWNRSNYSGHQSNWSMYNGTEEIQYEDNITNSRVISPVFEITTEYDEICVFLTYWHKYDLEYNDDGVQVQIKEADSTQWNILVPIEDYTGKSSGYGGFSLNEFFYSGTENTWHRHYIIIDPVYFNKDIQICWRFGSDPSVVAEGYYFDDVKVFTLQRYSTEEDLSVQNDAMNVIYRYGMKCIGSNIVRDRFIIEYSVGDEVLVEISVFDITGRKVSDIESMTRTPGIYRVYWYCNDDKMFPVSSGLYFIRMTAGDFNQTNKMLFVR